MTTGGRAGGRSYAHGCSVQRPARQPARKAQSAPAPAVPEQAPPPCGWPGFWGAPSSPLPKAPPPRARTRAPPGRVPEGGRQLLLPKSGCTRPDEAGAGTNSAPPLRRRAVVARRRVVLDDADAAEGTRAAGAGNELRATERRDGRAFRRRRRRAEAAEGRVGQIARRCVRLREDAEAARRLGRGLLRHGAGGPSSVADLWAEL